MMTKITDLHWFPAQVKVALRVTPTMLSDYQRDHEIEDWESITNGNRLDINDDLIIEFNNTTQQVLDSNTECPLACDS